MVTDNTMASPPSASASPLTTWVKQHALLAYMLLTFGLTWPWMVAEVLGSRGIVPFRLTLSGVGIFLTLFVAYGPTLAALLITSIIGGRAAVRTLLGRLLIWRVGWRWYAAAIGLPGLISLGAITLATVRGAPVEPLPPFSWGMLLTLPLAFLVRGSINGEEIGWRGFALPQLQSRWNALAASLWLGTVWALFHLPIFFVQGASLLGSQNDMNPLAFLIDVVAGAVLMTWLFNQTQGSLLIAYLYHAAVNTWTTEIFHLNNIDSALVTLVVATLVVMRYGPAHLAHKSVAAKPDRREDKR